MNNLKEKILIADDDPNIVKILMDRLKSRGFRVTAASDGEECLDQMEKGNHSILILDLQMPRMDGMEVLEEVKRINPEIDVIMMTAYGTIDMAVRAMKAGAADYITKPIELDELSILLERISERRAMRKENEGLCGV